MSASLLVPAHPAPHLPHDPRHLRAALEGLAAGILTFDAALRPLFCNDRLIDMLELSPEAAEAATVLDLLEASILDADTVQRVHALCLRLAASGPNNRGTLGLSDRRAARSFALTVTRLSDGSALASFEDVTAARLAEACAIERAMCDLPRRPDHATSVSSAAASASISVAPSTSPV